MVASVHVPVRKFADISIDIFVPRPLSPTIYIERWSPCKVYCRRQCISIDFSLVNCRWQKTNDRFLPRLLSPIVSIDRCVHSSIAEAIEHCCVYCPGCASYDWYSYVVPSPINDVFPWCTCWTDKLSIGRAWMGLILRTSTPDFSSFSGTGGISVTSVVVLVFP